MSQTSFNYLVEMPLFLEDNFMLLILVAAWSLPWKGVALWRAARLSDKWWFIAILVLNTLAIMDIIYIYFISERKTLKRRHVFQK